MIGDFHWPAPPRKHDGDRRVPPIAITLLLHIYSIAEPIRDCPAHRDWLHTFLAEDLIQQDFESGSAFSLTTKGREWVERILNTLPPRAYGGESKGFYIIGQSEAAFPTIESARMEAMCKIEKASSWHNTFPSYLCGAYVLKATELIEPVAAIKPNFRTTYLS